MQYLNIAFFFCLNVWYCHFFYHIFAFKYNEYNMKKILIILLQLTIFFIAALPILSVNMISIYGNSISNIKIVHDIWYYLMSMSLIIVVYAYYRYILDAWYVFEDILMIKFKYLKDFILSVQKWRIRLFVVLYIIVVIYLIFFCS